MFQFQGKLFLIWTMKIIVLIGFIFTLAAPCRGRLHKGSQFCEFYNSTSKCPECDPKVIECTRMRSNDNSTYDTARNHMSCFASWRYDDNNVNDPIILVKACWLNNDFCKNKRKCIETRPVQPAFYCCCDGEMCNKNVEHNPIFTEEDRAIALQKKNRERNGSSKNDENGRSTPDVEKPGAVHTSNRNELKKTIIYIAVPIVAVATLLVAFYFMWRRHQHHPGHRQLPTMDPNLMHTPLDEALDIELLEQKAKGRFGYVWKAKLHDKLVAVKIFPLADKKSFSAEVDVYKQSNMRHENILQFIGSEVKQENSYTEFFLITEYHERGSLHDFLKANTITWAQLCRIGETMTCGLTYLHDEIVGTHDTPTKPAIAHRDLKSKNILVKSDLSTCIADFGLALVYDPLVGINETHTQVGTRRYMAPEVLEGAICFNMDAFLRIDMYACSLVLWELMTRCTCVEGVIDEYRLPFEAEVGQQPSLEEMQPLVAGQKRRPAIKPAWYQSQGMANLVATIEECWDQDAEARLSAGCVHDRIAQFSRTINTGSDNNVTTPTNTATPLPSPPPPIHSQQRQQQFIHDQQFQHQQHHSPVANNYLSSNNNNNMNNNNNNNNNNVNNQHYHPHHFQHQELPPVYVANNNTNFIDVNRRGDGNSSTNNTLSSSPTGMTDLSSC